MEIWKDIPGYEDSYQISNLGNARTKTRKVYHSKGFHTVYGKPLKLSIGTTGYYEISLFKGNKKKHGKIHRLVGALFVDNPKNKPQINHKDGNKLNNNDWNLEWCTAKENTKHSIDVLGNYVPPPQLGTSNWGSKMNELQVRIIKKLKGEMKPKDVLKYFPVNDERAITRIWNGTLWKHI